MKHKCRYCPMDDSDVPWNIQDIYAVCQNSSCYDIFKIMDDNKFQSDIFSIIHHTTKHIWLRFSKILKILCQDYNKCTKLEVYYTALILLSPVYLREKILYKCGKALTLYALSNDNFKLSKSQRANLILNVGRFHRWMVDYKVAGFIKEYSSVYATAFIDALIEELLFMALYTNLDYQKNILQHQDVAGVNIFMDEMNCGNKNFITFMAQNTLDNLIFGYPFFYGMESFYYNLMLTITKINDYILLIIALHEKNNNGGSQQINFSHIGGILNKILPCINNISLDNRLFVDSNPTILDNALNNPSNRLTNHVHRMDVLLICKSFVNIEECSRITSETTAFLWLNSNFHGFVRSFCRDFINGFFNLITDSSNFDPNTFLTSFNNNNNNSNLVENESNFIADYQDIPNIYKWMDTLLDENDFHPYQLLNNRCSHRIPVWTRQAIRKFFTITSRLKDEGLDMNQIPSLYNWLMVIFVFLEYRNSQYIIERDVDMAAYMLIPHSTPYFLPTNLLKMYQEPMDIIHHTYDGIDAFENVGQSERLNIHTNLINSFNNGLFVSNSSLTYNLADNNNINHHHITNKIMSEAMINNFEAHNRQCLAFEMIASGNTHLVPFILKYWAGSPLITSTGEKSSSQKAIMFSPSNINTHNVTNDDSLFKSQLIITPLMYATIDDNYDMVKALLSHGVDIDKDIVISNTIGCCNHLPSCHSEIFHWTALSFSVIFNYTSIIELLLENGANVEGGIKHGEELCFSETPLQLACATGKLENVLLLLSRGGDPYLCTAYNHRSSCCLPPSPSPQLINQSVTTNHFNYISRTRHNGHTLAGRRITISDTLLSSNILQNNSLVPHSHNINTNLNLTNSSFTALTNFYRNSSSNDTTTAASQNSLLFRSNTLNENILARNNNNNNSYLNNYENVTTSQNNTTSGNTTHNILTTLQLSNFVLDAMNNINSSQHGGGCSNPFTSLNLNNDVSGNISENNTSLDNTNNTTILSHNNHNNNNQQQQNIHIQAPSTLFYDGPGRSHYQHFNHTHNHTYNQNNEYHHPLNSHHGIRAGSHAPFVLSASHGRLDIVEAMLAQPLVPKPRDILSLEEILAEGCSLYHSAHNNNNHNSNNTLNVSRDGCSNSLLNVRGSATTSCSRGVSPASGHEGSLSKCHSPNPSIFSNSSLGVTDSYNGTGGNFLTIPSSSHSPNLHGSNSSLANNLVINSDRSSTSVSPKEKEKTSTIFKFPVVATSAQSPRSIENFESLTKSTAVETNVQYNYQGQQPTSSKLITPMIVTEFKKEHIFSSQLPLSIQANNNPNNAPISFIKGKEKDSKDKVTRKNSQNIFGKKVQGFTFMPNVSTNNGTSNDPSSVSSNNSEESTSSNNFFTQNYIFPNALQSKNNKNISSKNGTNQNALNDLSNLGGDFLTLAEILAEGYIPPAIMLSKTNDQKGTKNIVENPEGNLGLKEHPRCNRTTSLQQQHQQSHSSTVGNNIGCLHTHSYHGKTAIHGKNNGTITLVRTDNNKRRLKCTAYNKQQNHQQFQNKYYYANYPMCTLTKAQARVLFEAMYHASESGHVDICMALRKQGIIWNLHIWITCLVNLYEKHMPQDPYPCTNIIDNKNSQNIFDNINQAHKINEKLVYSLLKDINLCALLQDFPNVKFDEVNIQEFVNLAVPILFDLFRQSVNAYLDESLNKISNIKSSSIDSNETLCNSLNGYITYNVEEFLHSPKKQQLDSKSHLNFFIASDTHMTHFKALLLALTNILSSIYSGTSFRSPATNIAPSSIISTNNHENLNNNCPNNVMSPILPTPIPQPITGKRSTLIDPCYVNSPELSDISFLVEGATFYAHKIILVNSSPRFKAMLCDKFAESNQHIIPIKDIRYEIFKVIMEFLYSGKIDNINNQDADFVMELMAASNYFLLDNLQRECEIFASKILNLQNCVTIYKTAKLYACEELAKYCCGYFLLNLSYMCFHYTSPTSSLSSLTKQLSSPEPSTSNYVIENDDLTKPETAKISHKNSLPIKICDVDDISNLSSHPKLENTTSNMTFQSVDDKSIQNLNQNLGNGGNRGTNSFLNIFQQADLATETYERMNQLIIERLLARLNR